MQTGIRLSEAAALTTADIELPARVSRDGPPGSMQVHGKRRKERTVTVNWRACKALKAWLAIRPTNRGDALFFTKFRRPLGPRGIQHLARKHLRDAGITGASVHSLSHTFGTHMVRKGVHLDVIRKVLGHESLTPRPSTRTSPGSRWTGSCRSTRCERIRGQRGLARLARDIGTPNSFGGGR